jgi:UDP-N-acetylglucosamine transferase subunit ALG13
VPDAEDPSSGYTTPEWDELSSRCEQALAVAERAVADSQVYLDQAVLVLRSATSRGAALLRAALVLSQSGLANALGPTIRSIYETWLVGYFGGLGGSDEHLLMVDQFDYEWNQLSTHLPVVPKRRHQGAKLSIWTYADTVRSLLDSNEHPMAGFPVRGFNVMYRIESLFSVHAGLASIGLAVTDDDDRVIVPRESFDDRRNRHRMMLALSMVISLCSLLTWNCKLERAQVLELEEWIVKLRPTAYASE